jgi:hypothetical protein
MKIIFFSDCFDSIKLVSINESRRSGENKEQAIPPSRHVLP